jgi:outer membrane protein, heavy metal efflux system
MYRITLLLLLSVLLAVTGCTVQESGVATAVSADSNEDVDSRPDNPSVPLLNPETTIDASMARALALKHNPQLRAAVHDRTASEARYRKTTRIPNPELEIELEEFGGSEEREGLDSARTIVKLSQELELFGSRGGRMSVARSEQRIHALLCGSTRLDVIAEVDRCVVAVLASQERLTIAQQSVKTVNAQLTATIERERAGKTTVLEVRRARIALTNQRMTMQRLARELVAHKRVLATTWGGTIVPAKVSGDLTRMQEPQKLKGSVAAIEANPDVALLGVEIEMAQGRIRQEKAGRVSSVTLSAGVEHSREEEDDTYMVGLSIPLPLFDRNSDSVAESRASLHSAVNRSNARRLQLTTRLQQEHGALQGAYQEARVYADKVVPAAQEALDLADAGYRDGKFTYLELLDAQQLLYESKLAYIDALEAYHNAVIAMERLTAIHREKE